MVVRNIRDSFSPTRFHSKSFALATYLVMLSSRKSQLQKIGETSIENASESQKRQLPDRPPCTSGCLKPEACVSVSESEIN